MPPTRNVPCGVSTSTAADFGNGSVVMMASAASDPPALSSAGRGLGDAAAHSGHLQIHADHAGGGHQHVDGRAAERRGRQRRHLARIVQALRTRAGIGAAAVGDDGAGRPARGGQVGLRHQHRRRLRQVQREQGGRGRRCVAGQEREVGLAAGLDAAVQAGRPEAARRGDAAGHDPETRGHRGVTRAPAAAGRGVTGRRRAGRSCGTAGSPGSRRGSSRAPSGGARLRSRDARRSRGRA